MDKTATIKYENFSLTLTEADILACATLGDCEGDKDRVSQKEYVQKQLKDLPLSYLTHELDNMGISYKEGNRQNAESLIVWDAACYLKAELTGSLY